MDGSRPAFLPCGPGHIRATIGDSSFFTAALSSDILLFVSLPTSVKRIIIELLGWIPSRGIYRVLRRPIRWSLPDRIVSRIPVVGKIRVDLPNGKQIVLRSDGRDSIASALFWNGLAGFEPEVLFLFTRLLQGVHTVLDVGAHTGIYGLIAAATDPGIQVYAFEPDPEIFEYLKRNVQENEATNLIAERMAMADRCGELTLYVPNAACLASGASTLQGFRASTRGRQVQATTVDEYVRSKNITRVDLMKIDTEATEHLVLQGAGATLDRDHPVVICEVLHGLTEKFLHSIFDPRPYLFFHITSEGLTPLDTLIGDPSHKCRNVLFIHESEVARVSELILSPGPGHHNVSIA